MRRLTAVVALLLVALTACSSGGGGSTPMPHPPDRTLVAAAHLKPCPTSSTTAVPDGLPDLTLACLAPGRSVHMAGLTGKPSVVNIWGSWCLPCRKEAQYLASAFNADHKRVRFLGVDVVDSANSALDFDAHVTPPVHFPSVFDPNRRFAIALRVVSPPYTVFVDRTGRIVGDKHGGYTSTAELQADITRYLDVPT
jgi:thiol-disulfide isomerase/thioredoxin